MDDAMDLMTKLADQWRYTRWAGLDAFLAQLAPEGLDRAISYTTSDSRAFTSLVGDIVLHVCLHSQHHRGRINRHLRDAGYDPVPSDYIAFVRGRDAAKADLR